MTLTDNGRWANKHTASEVKRELRGQMPDETDRRNIVKLIQLYDQVYPFPHPESLQAAIQEGLKMTDKAVGTIRTTKDKGVNQLALHLPTPFVLKLKKAYPLIFSDQGQCEWFLKNFPAFNLRNY